MRRAHTLLTALALVASLAACAGSPPVGARGRVAGAPPPPQQQPTAADQPRAPAEPYPGKLIHVVVALCDNVNQGIVPVPAALGDGEDPRRNLYWGAAYGVETYFRKARDWVVVAEAQGPRPHVLRRLVFKHRSADAYLVADAYRGAEIKRATLDFLEEAAGLSRETVELGGKTYGLRGAAGHLVVYVGHNGLMDFTLPSYPKGQAATPARDAVVLACASRSYFAGALREAGARPVLWTTNLLAPEAYVVKAAADGWLAGDGGEAMRLRAARAYHAYQKCGLRAAQNLFASGW